MNALERLAHHVHRIREEGQGPDLPDQSRKLAVGICFWLSWRVRSLLLRVQCKELVEIAAKNHAEAACQLVCYSSITHSEISVTLPLRTASQASEGISKVAAAAGANRDKLQRSSQN